MQPTPIGIGQCKLDPISEDDIEVVLTCYKGMTCFDVADSVGHEKDQDEEPTVKEQVQTLN